MTADRIPATAVPLDVARRLGEYPDLAAAATKLFGKVTATPGEKLARISWLGMVLGSGKGDATRGRPLFTQHCGVCHTLFGQGGKVGPEMTGADRKNRTAMLTHIVDPSAVIRQEFAAVRLDTTDGRTLTGLITEQSPQAVTLLDARAERTIVPRDRIDTITVSPVSLMPEKLLDALTDQQVRDLFAYLAADVAPPPPAPPGGKKFTVCLVSGSGEYQSNESLAAFQS